MPAAAHAVVGLQRELEGRKAIPVLGLGRHDLHARIGQCRAHARTDESRECGRHGRVGFVLRRDGIEVLMPGVKDYIRPPRAVGRTCGGDAREKIISPEKKVGRPSSFSESPCHYAP